jgi:hypothetical protein
MLHAWLNLLRHDLVKSYQMWRPVNHLVAYDEGSCLTMWPFYDGGRAIKWSSCSPLRPLASLCTLGSDLVEKRAIENAQDVILPQFAILRPE